MLFGPVLKLNDAFGNDDGAGGNFNESDLLNSLLDGVDLGGREIKTKEDLKKALSELVQTQGKYKDLEGGFTKSTQKLSALENRLRQLGIGDVNSFLEGKQGPQMSKKERLKALFDKYKFSAEVLPFYEELSDIMGPDEDYQQKMTQPAMHALTLALALARENWKQGFRSKSEYKDVGDDVMEELFKRIPNDPDALREFIQTGRNPLEKHYPAYYAEKNPNILSQKIEKKAEEKKGKGSGFIERPGIGAGPSKAGSKSEGKDRVANLKHQFEENHGIEIPENSET